MNFNEYRPLALRTAKMFPTRREDMRHALLGLITETGELATEVKRLAIYGKPETPEMLAHMREEAGDTLWYIPLAMLALGIDDLPPLSEDQLSTLPSGLADASVFLSAMVGGMCAYYIVPNEYADEVGELAHVISGIVHAIDNVIAPLIGTTGDALRAENIAKLRQRFPDKYSDAAAEARADKGGLDARNS